MTTKTGKKSIEVPAGTVGTRPPGSPWKHGLVATLAGCGLAAAAATVPGSWDTAPDTWVATDGLGRVVPAFPEVGAPRADRTVGLFYFLWLGAHVTGGPWDVTRILAQHPGAMTNRNSPPWGPLHASHHWGESIFGYYNTDDPYVLRKHAQMLGDAGVDVIIFDVTNQVTYRSNYLALLRVFTAARQRGARAPQVAFLCPFWDPAKVVNELFRDLYGPGLYPDLWFQWEGKPLLLADPEKLGQSVTYDKHDTPVALAKEGSLGQSFVADQPFDSVAGSFPTWGTTGAAVRLTLRQGGPQGEVVARQFCERVTDNAWLSVRPPRPCPAGPYYLEASEATGRIGWWSSRADTQPRGQAFADGQPTAGDRSLRLIYVSQDAQRIRDFFTFRRPQPDYFQGQLVPDTWSWLEVYPQHVFTNSAGQKEQMSVGVAQNAVGRRLGSMSEPGARGRSFHGGARDPRPEAVNLGLNFTEQFDRARREDPRFLFITGWNEWIMGRFNEFAGVRYPVMFVDEFDQECSRDIEPMKGGHQDHYYYQMISAIRRYKGARPAPRASGPQTIRLDADFAQWETVRPEYRDDRDDTLARDWPGYNQHTRYVNRTGRNDLVAAQVARDDQFVYFHVRTQEALTPRTDTNWMWLLLDTDCDHRTGWEGYDFLVNRQVSDATTTLERHAGVGWSWQAVASVKLFAGSNELHLAIPRAALGLEAKDKPLRFDFKWADNVPAPAPIVQWLDSGDCAPNGRFNYRFEE